MEQSTLVRHLILYLADTYTFIIKEAPMAGVISSYSKPVRLLEGQLLEALPLFHVHRMSQEQHLLAPLCLLVVYGVRIADRTRKSSVETDTRFDRSCKDEHSELVVFLRG